MLFEILKVSSQDIYGFDFEDNEVPKYLTERNGVAEISVKEWTSFDQLFSNPIFSILVDNEINFLHMVVSQVVKMA